MEDERDKYFEEFRAIPVDRFFGNQDFGREANIQFDKEYQDIQMVEYVDPSFII